MFNVKFLIVFCCMCVGIASFAATVYPKNWSWNLNDAAKLKAIDTTNVKKKFNAYITIQIALVGKDSSNITYKQFKDIIKELNGGKYYKLVPQISRCINRFRPFMTEVLKDPEFANSSYAINWIALKVYNNSTAFRKYFFEDQKITKTQNNLVALNRIFNKYEKYSLSYSADQVKSDMALFKRLTYTKIGLNEKYKELAVKIELLTKSVQ